MDGAWAAAGEALERAYGLFLHDVARAWAARACADREKAARGEEAPYLGQEVRCALVEASLHSLAGNLPPELVAQLVRGGLWQPRQALTYARQMPDEGQRARALAALAPRLPPERLSEALAALAPRLPPERQEQALHEALAAAREIRDEDARARACARALASMASHLAAFPRPALYPLWDETLRALARRTRRDLLADLRALMPLILRLGGPQAIAETFRAVRDVARWWP